MMQFFGDEEEDADLPEADIAGERTGEDSEEEDVDNVSQMQEEVPWKTGESNPNVGFYRTCVHTDHDVISCHGSRGRESR